MLKQHPGSHRIISLVDVCRYTDIRLLRTSRSIEINDYRFPGKGFRNFSYTPLSVRYIRIASYRFGVPFSKHGYYMVLTCKVVR
jgi:hypothetical protein